MITHALIVAASLMTQTPAPAVDWVKDGTFTQGIEGPAVDSQGNLFAVNFAQQGSIGIVDANGNTTLFSRLNNGSIGNGIRFDQHGNMYIADYVNHNILTIAKGQRHASVFAHNANMNQPNDIAISRDGVLYASDPNWAKGTGQLWRIDTDGQTHLLAKDMGTTNGVELSPDNSTLYVNESVQRKIWQFDLDANGNISNKRLLIAFDEFGLDGMRSDKQGNLYVARYGKGVVAIVSPSGDLLGEVTLTGQYPTNVAFGGKQGRDVFVTMQKRGAIERFIAPFSGRSFNNVNE